MRRALFWKLTQRRTIFPYRRFGTTCLSRRQGSSSPGRIPRLLDPWRWDRWFPQNVVTNCRSTLRQIPKERRSRYIAAETWFDAIPKHTLEKFLRGFPELLRDDTQMRGRSWAQFGNEKTDIWKILYRKL